LVAVPDSAITTGKQASTTAVQDKALRLIENPLFSN
jgi:hypothetical protein